jgi:hypothetical protein
LVNVVAMLARTIYLHAHTVTCRWDRVVLLLDARRHECHSLSTLQKAVSSFLQNSGEDCAFVNAWAVLAQIVRQAPGWPFRRIRHRQDASGIAWNGMGSLVPATSIDKST